MIELKVVDPPTLNAVRAFLKDNDIVCVPSADNRVGTLSKKLSDLRNEGRERFKDSNVVPIVAANEG
jgi:hypothetical protein